MKARFTFAIAALVFAAAIVHMNGSTGRTFALFPCPSNPALTCVMSGLDSPRGLAFGPEGALYVAEAGRGGANLDDPDDGFCCFTGPLGGSLAYGRTGAVTRLWDGYQQQVATGLPSIAPPNGNRAVGPQDISFLGRGGAYVTLGLEAAPAFRDALAAERIRMNLLTDLTRPTSVAVGPDGAIYVSNSGIVAGTGEVMRVEPDLAAARMEN